jgi:hypothetical protein
VRVAKLLNLRKNHARQPALLCSIRVQQQHILFPLKL